MSEKKIDLLTDFPAVSTSEWMDKVTADLKGADFNKKLVWKTREGFNILPFYRGEDLDKYSLTDTQPGKFPYLRGTKLDNKWFVRQDIDVVDAKSANAKALELLYKGVDSLGFNVDSKDVNSQFIIELLQNIAADCVEINFTICRTKATELATLLTEYYKSKGYELAKLQGSINLDPIKSMLLRGRDISQEEIKTQISASVNATMALPHYRVVNVNSKILVNAGANVSQELGYALAWGNEYMAEMIDAGVEKVFAAKKIRFNMGIGGNYFMEIAKFRAARWLWALVIEAYEPDCNKSDCSHTENGKCKCAAKIKIHAETTTFNKTTYDAHVNLLRTQTEAMSASLGGVNSMTVLPFDITYKNADEFSQRIARNQQLLLKEESNFEKVTDPAAGSYYIETLTRQLAEQAWSLFLEVEEEGGFYNYVKSGKLQEKINATAKERMKNVSSRREILLGTNQFPNFTETAASKIAEKTANTENSVVATLNQNRAAEEFEALRLATEKSGKTPTVFMLTIGNLAMRLARAQFSCNFFACAGYQVIDNLGFKTVAEGVDAARKINADVIVLCSSDDEYVEYGVQAAELTQGKEILAIAGAPACTDDLKAKGVEHFINVKSNVLDTLKQFNSLLKID